MSRQWQRKDAWLKQMYYVKVAPIKELFYYIQPIPANLLQSMSHLRDIQKLRQARNSQQGIYPSRPTPESYNVIQDNWRNEDNLRAMRNTDVYSKFLQSKQITRQSKQKSTHKRGVSNGVTYYEKKDSDSIASGLSIHNFPLKLTQRTPNPLTSRKEKPQLFQPQSFIYQLKEKFPRPSKQIYNKPASTTSAPSNISKADFEIVYAIGKGGFGKVWKVVHKKTRVVYAMKEMYKAKIIMKKSINSVMNERMLLAKVRHPFLINMSFAFQDRQNLYLFMDYLDGGDLRYHIGKRRRFTQIQTKFFICCLLLTLEYLHSHKIIHRDIKPQNLILSSSGYLHLTDLGISREFKDQNYMDTSGTPGYMAPQVMCRKNHSYEVDYFAVGVMGYQFMMGRRPYVGKNRKEIRDAILAKQACIRPQENNGRWSYQSIDFINKLLQRNPSSRLGSNGIDEVKSHPWLASVDWEALYRKEIEAPYLPTSIEEDYEDYKQQISEDTIDDNLEENLLMLRDKEVQSLFQGYKFQRKEPSERKRSTAYTTYETESDHMRKDTR